MSGSLFTVEELKDKLDRFQGLWMDTTEEFIQQVKKKDERIAELEETKSAWPEVAELRLGEITSLSSKLALAEERNSKLSEFVKDIIRDICWEMGDPDGGSVQDRAVELGFLYEKIATEQDIKDCDCEYLEVGQTIFMFTDILASPTTGEKEVVCESELHCPICLHDPCDCPTGEKEPVEDGTETRIATCGACECSTLQVHRPTIDGKPYNKWVCQTCDDIVADEPL